MELSEMRKFLQKAYEEIPCKNCVVRPTCFKLNNNYLNIQKTCDNFKKWASESGVYKFWRRYDRYQPAEEIRTEIFKKLFF